MKELLLHLELVGLKETQNCPYINSLRLIYHHRHVLPFKGNFLKLLYTGKYTFFTLKLRNLLVFVQVVSRTKEEIYSLKQLK